MTYRASHVAQRVPAAELDVDANSLMVLVSSFGLLAASVPVVLAVYALTGVFGSVL